MASICKPQQRAAKGCAAPAPDACVADIDPKLECLDGATTYIIRLSLPGFKKEDFKVQVDSGGRLTVRGERPAGYVRFHKAFQLPQTANPDGVAGRFDGTVLSLTVPKQPASGRDMVAARLAEAEECAAARAAGEGAVTTTWAEALGGKGQMVAAAVAGFALGAFLAHRLLSVANT
ncbi:15.7 kDa heat shock protein, peroxisomal-like [Panicum miliaceum]|uniref:15.7 kDa heat shock protein, peroxisomal-like n=1 Tax=Panicum miliaceum TaxID=4540 RepID=A0A3L6SV02_PANMI|nr:15.7 kDa heat shock protein, peroxisomal-like [Panicum miliaceum]